MVVFLIWHYHAKLLVRFLTFPFLANCLKELEVLWVLEHIGPCCSLQLTYKSFLWDSSLLWGFLFRRCSCLGILGTKLNSSRRYLQGHILLVAITFDRDSWFKHEFQVPQKPAVACRKSGYGGIQGWGVVKSAVKHALWALKNPDMEMCWKACCTVVVFKASTTLTKLKSTRWLPVLDWYCLFFSTIRVHILRVSKKSKTSRAWVFECILFSIPFRSTYHARTYIPRLNHPAISMA